MEFIAFSLFLLLWGYLIIYLISSFSGTGKRDTTDDPTGEASGLRLYTDHATGVQYVGTLYGITPRIDKDGNLYRDGK